ncbi:MAG: glutamate-5-semialdehyde dehydrogenase [Woeseiaceae bacterium]
MNSTAAKTSVAKTMEAIGIAARAASKDLARSTSADRDAALEFASDVILERCDQIVAANHKDMTSARQKGLSAAMLDRLALDNERIRSIANGLRAIAALPNPLGKTLAEWSRPNGLTIARVSVPLGVIGIIYESRPNVTADAAGLCLKSGNAVILRGGSESYHSSFAIYQCLTEGLQHAKINTAAVQMVPTTDRTAVGYLLSSMNRYLDVVVPRGGKSLIQRVQEEARVPVIGHLEGICHVYLHESADTEMAKQITVNAKMRRTGICGAAETLLIDEAAAERLVPEICTALVNSGCEIRGDETVQRLFEPSIAAKEEDWSTEYLDSIISVRVVPDIRAATKHIANYGSGHTECIVADDSEAANIFFTDVDSAILLHNASTQFADGGEFGMGAEIGIATDRIHARGPVGAEQLTSYKYIVRGEGQTRP